MGLDVDKFFDFISREQRTLAIPILMALPIVYTILMLYVDGYSDYVIFDRCVFAIAATLSGMAICIAAIRLIGRVFPVQVGADVFVVVICAILLVGILVSLFGGTISIGWIVGQYLLSVLILAVCSALSR